MKKAFAVYEARRMLFSESGYPGGEKLYACSKSASIGNVSFDRP